MGWDAPCGGYRSGMVRILAFARLSLGKWIYLFILLECKVGAPGTGRWGRAAQLSGEGSHSTMDTCWGVGWRDRGGGSWEGRGRGGRWGGGRVRPAVRRGGEVGDQGRSLRRRVGMVVAARG